MRTKHLPPLVVGDHVAIQDQTGKTPRAWSKTGIIVEVLPYHSYHVKVDGSNHVTKRNRQFLRKIIPFTPNYPTPPPVSPVPSHPTIDDQINPEPTGLQVDPEQSNTAGADPGPPLPHDSHTDVQVPVEPNQPDPTRRAAVKHKPKHLRIKWIVNPALKRNTSVNLP